VPAVGVKTIESLITAQAEALAFEAGKTVFMDKDECIQKADQYGISLFGLKNA
jgi:DUF1009 family protein